MSHVHDAPAAIPLKDRATQGVVLLGAAGACMFVYAVDPAAESDPYPACPFLALTGYACPGCGALRATNRLLHGDLGAAFGLNALYVLMLPLLVYVVAGMAAQVVGRPLPKLRWPTWSGWAAAAVVALFWIVRNIPVDPFLALAP